MRKEDSFMFSPNNTSYQGSSNSLADDLAFDVQNNQRDSRNRFIERQCQTIAMQDPSAYQNVNVENFDASDAMQNYENQMNEQMNGQYGNAYGGNKGIGSFLDSLGNKVKNSYDKLKQKLNGENPIEALCIYICYKFLKTAAKYELKFYPDHQKSVEQGYKQGTEAIASISPAVAQTFEPISDIESADGIKPINIQQVDPALYQNNQKQNEGDQMQL